MASVIQPKNIPICTVYANRKSPYSNCNYSVVSLSHYSSLIVVLTVTGILANSTPQ